DHAAIILVDTVECVRPHRVELRIAAHHALGISRGARGVHNGVEVPRLDRSRKLQHGRILFSRIDQCANVKAFNGLGFALNDEHGLYLAGRDLFETLDHRRGSNQKLSIGIIKNVLKHTTACACVDRHIDGAEIVDGEPGAQKVGTIADEAENVVTPLDTRRCQRRGAEAHPPQRVTIAPLIPWPELHKGSLRLLSRVGFEDVAKHGAIAVEGRFRCESCIDSHVRVSFLRASHMPPGPPPTLMSRQKYALQSRNQICSILSSMSKRFSTFDRRYKVL